MSVATKDQQIIPTELPWGTPVEVDFGGAVTRIVYCDGPSFRNSRFGMPHRWPVYAVITRVLQITEPPAPRPPEVYTLWAAAQTTVAQLIRA